MNNRLVLFRKIDEFTTKYGYMPNGLFHPYLRSPFPVLGVSCILFYFYCIFDRNLLANIVDSDQTPQSVGSDMGLHCLPKS